MARIVSPTMPPGAHSLGDVWYHTLSGLTFEWQRTAAGFGVWVQTIIAGPPVISALAPVTSGTPLCTSSPLAPDNPDPCDLWYHTESGVFFIYYDDGDTRQWVTTQPTKVGDIIVVTGPAGGDLAGSYPNPTIKDDVELVRPTTAALPAIGVDTLELVPAQWVNDKFALLPAPPVTLPPSGPAGGALAGTYPNPTLVGGPLSSYAPLANPQFTGVPTTPTAAQNTDTTQIASCAFVNVQLGGQLQFFAPLASPTFTGDPRAPTPATGDNDTSIATTAFVKALGYAPTSYVDSVASLKAPIASPTFTGDPKAPTPSTADNDTSVATTAFVRAAITSFSPPPDLTPYALIASPTFMGDPKAPTPATADNDTSIATTAYVKANIAALPAAPTTLPPNGPAGGALAGTYPNPTLVGGPLSNYALSSSIPTTLPPNGAAGGDLSGTYPNPLIKPSVTNGQVLTTVAGVAAWAAASGGGASISVGTTPPGSPTAGALWWNNDASVGGGQLFIYYNDGNTSQWVPTTPAPSGPSAVFGHLNGCTLSNSGAWGIVFAAGQFTDSTNVATVSFGGITKLLNATWVAGSGNGGRGPGVAAPTAAAYYHCFAAIINGASDAFFDSSLTGANAPPGTTYKRRVGSVLIESPGAANIYPFLQYNDDFLWVAPIQIASTWPASPSLIASWTPPGLRTQFIGALQSECQAGLSIAYYLSDDGPNLNLPTFYMSGPGTATRVGGGGVFYCWTNLTSQIRYQHGGSAQSISITANGYRDPRGRTGGP